MSEHIMDTYNDYNSYEKLVEHIFINKKIGIRIIISATKFRSVLIVSHLFLILSTNFIIILFINHSAHQLIQNLDLIFFVLKLY